MGSENWQYLTLANPIFEIIDGDRGLNYPNGNDFSQDGFCLFLNAKNVTRDGFRFEQCQFITSEKDKLLNKGKLRREDVILTTRGTVGNVAFYSRSVSFDHIRINSGMVILRFDPQIADSQFMYWLFRSSLIQDQVVSLSTGSAQPQLPINQLKNISLFLPPIIEQRSIAATLSCLDDKIELNNRIIANLEAQAQAIFKSWFVDFEPFQDGEFEESEWRLIPKGWRVVPFTEVVQVLGGGTPKTDVADNWNGDIPFFTPKDAGSTTYALQTEKALTDKGLKACNSGLYPENTVFVTARGTVGKIALAGKPMAMNQSCYALVGKNGISQYFVYHLTQNTVERLKGKASGAVFDAIVTRDFDSELIVSPKEGATIKFSSLVEPLYQQMLCLEKQNIVLRITRDSMLPKLMSGEIEVPVEGI